MPENLLGWYPSSRWFPDADVVGAPNGVLLRADNTIPDVSGARVLRAGSNALVTGLQDLRVGSIHTSTLNGTQWRMLGAGNRVYANDTVLGGEFDSSGDIVFGDDSYQIFAARGKVKKKWDGVMFHNSER